ncbi:MAG: hypothetical protein NUV54_01740 [Candidatus Taylorbacteria bacterium]|nr:hypothetical protein [Candidatus Taylorbacteria bacterium]
MSKKTATVIIILAIILAIAGVIAFYFYSNRDVTGGNNPVGGTNIFPTTDTGTPTTKTPDTQTTETPRVQSSGTQPVLVELSTRPSAGATALATSSSDVVFVRFVEKGTGNVYEVSPTVVGETRLSNTTIPKIQEVFWSKAGNSFIARYEKDGTSDTIATYYAVLTTPSDGFSVGEVKGVYLPDNIPFLTLNPDRTKVFYLLNHTNGSSGVVAELDGTKKIGVLDSPLQDWLPQWATPQTVALTTKGSSSAPGFMYLLNTQTGALTDAIANIQGLTTLVGPDGVSILYSENGDRGLLLKTYSLKTGISFDTSVQTLPEKCVWSARLPDTAYCSVPIYLPSSIYPDGWYQGVVSFSDDIWKIDTRTGTGELVASLKKLGGQDIDGTNLFLDPQETHLFFTNKRNFHVWSLRLP